MLHATFEPLKNKTRNQQGGNAQQVELPHYVLSKQTASKENGQLSLLKG